MMLICYGLDYRMVTDRGVADMILNTGSTLQDMCNKIVIQTNHECIYLLFLIINVQNVCCHVHM